MTPLDIILIIITIAALALLWRWLGGAKRREAQRRIARVRKRSSSGAAWSSLRRKRAEELKGLLFWLTKPLPDFKRLGERLERAGKTITPKQYALRCGLSVLMIMVIVSGLFKKPLLLGLFLGIILAVWLPLKVLDFAINKQAKAFIALFPDAIDLIVRGLRSGLPVSESLVLVSQEVPNPVGGVFSNISNTMKLGVTLEKALQETAHKLDISEFNFFVTSILLQRETGGNLSEILNNLSEVLRGRLIMRMKIRAMSSEARASTVIIGALPFVVILAVAAISPDYMKPLITDYRGNICAAIAAGMLFGGIFIMNKMSNFEI